MEKQKELHITNNILKKEIPKEEIFGHRLRPLLPRAPGMQNVLEMEAEYLRVGEGRRATLDALTPHSQGLPVPPLSQRHPSSLSSAAFHDYCWDLGVGEGSGQEKEWRSLKLC